MTSTHTTRRYRLADLPAAARAELESHLGAPVTGEDSQSGGYTPGIASRLVLEDGQRAFLKAIPAGDELADTYRAEAAVAQSLPTATPAPRLWWAGVVDGWLLAVFDDVDGRHPSISPGSPDLPAVVAAITTLGHELTPCPHDGAPTARAEWEPLLHGWRSLAAQPPADLDPWSAKHLAELAELEPLCLTAMAGDTLLHTDLRPDNLMISHGDGQVVVIDWAWPARGAAWVDVAFLVPQLILAGHSPQAAEEMLEQMPAWRGADQQVLTSFAVALTGLWETQWRADTREDLRRYHVAAANAGRAWAAYRTGWFTS